MGGIFQQTPRNGKARVNSPSKKVTVWIVVLLALLLLAGIGAVARKISHDADAAADHSAHAALTAEICDRLADVPDGQPYPPSLSQLQLTFPDGGNASLLGRFTYTSNRRNCTVRTLLRGQEFVRSYPSSMRNEWSNHALSEGRRADHRHVASTGIRISTCPTGSMHQRCRKVNRPPNVSCLPPSSHVRFSAALKGPVT
jgi:hypothetical protein